ncbi:MAG: hypothetical protein M3254_08900 [Actinomycetota bacterium]|nr:hypothetical protein [Actinomycetota bacterium]
MLIMAILAIAGLAAVPAIAQDLEDEIEQEAESGDFEAEADITLSGDSSNQCAPVLQFGNTGNIQNAQTLAQYNSEAEDIEIEGATISFDPEFVNECLQSVEQAAAAG